MRESGTYARTRTNTGIVTKPHVVDPPFPFTLFHSTSPNGHSTEWMPTEPRKGNTSSPRTYQPVEFAATGGLSPMLRLDFKHHRIAY